MVVADYIRAHKGEIATEWEKTVTSHLQELAGLERAALIDHLPEYLDGLAAWIEGKTADADSAFTALADGHAVQRLGWGIELATVAIELGRLRAVILGQLLSVPSSPEVRTELLRLNEGMDRAIALSVKRYTQRRELIRNRFISILAHDLRDPLNAVTMVAGMLDSVGPLNDRQREMTKTIVTATAAMDTMIRDVLDFARSHLGEGIPAVPEKNDLGAICEAVVERVKIAHPARRIELTKSGDLVGLFDRPRTQQALSNLVGNALRHGQDPVQIEAHEAPDRASLILTVKNRGTIPPERVPRLFEAFTAGVDPLAHGLGLGLFITNQIVLSHGGNIQVASSGGETTFTVTFPRSRDSAELR